MFNFLWWFLPILSACGALGHYLSKKHKSALSEIVNASKSIHEQLEKANAEIREKTLEIEKLRKAINEQEGKLAHLSFCVSSSEELLQDEKKRREAYQEIDKRIALMINDHAKELEVKARENSELEGRLCSMQVKLDASEQREKENQALISRLTHDLNSANSELSKLSTYVKEYQTASIVIKSGRSVKQHGYLQENRGALNKATS